MPGKCSFSVMWLSCEKYKNWLAADSDASRARCKLCKKSFDVSNMGEAALASHARGAKHAKFELMAREGSVVSFFGTRVAQQASGPSRPGPSTSQTALNLTPAPLATAASHAEVMWALRVATSHYSFNSCNEIGPLFSKMFPDSDIARKFTCGGTKVAYLSTFGLAPYFKSHLLREISRQSGYCVLFDESLNRELQRKQLDLHVRIWDCGAVQTRYLGSEFFGQATARDVVDKLSGVLTDMGLHNLVQVSMDGPNVNWKIFDLLQKEPLAAINRSLLNIGSCGLHIMHNAFRRGAKATGWDVDHTLNSMYWLFKDSPSRRDDFTKVTGSNTFAFKFCQHRWIENVGVCDRALSILPDMLRYVEAAKGRVITEPKCKSYEEVKKQASNNLFPVHVAIFSSIAKQVTPFMTAYQTDAPMLPFMTGDMYTLIKGLMERFMKDIALKEATTMQKLLQISINNSSLHKEASKIDIGFQGETLIRQLKGSGKVTEKQVLDVRMETKTFLIELLGKLLHKAPVQHLLVRNMQCLDPRIMATKKNQCVEKMQSILRTLTAANQVDVAICDKVLQEFREFLDVATASPAFAEFDPTSQRVDTLFSEHIAPKSAWKHLWHVVQILLVMSHGQASVERGFSVNKQVMVENMKAKSLVAQRMIADAIRAAGGLEKVSITKEMQVFATSARQRYVAYLEDQRKEAESLSKKRSLSGEIKELRQKKMRLESDIQQLEKSADDLAMKAETTRSIGFVVQSNSLRQSAKEKRASLSALDKEIEAKKKRMDQ